MQVIELFAGSRSIGKAAETLGMDVWSTDLNPFTGIDRAQDLLSIPITEIPKNDNPTILWASPPCTGGGTICLRAKLGTQKRRGRAGRCGRSRDRQTARGQAEAQNGSGAD